MRIAAIFVAVAAIIRVLKLSILYFVIALKNLEFINIFDKNK